MNLKGNTIFITGGGSGIGRGLAEAFKALGNKVIIAGRRESILREVTAANPGMEYITLDAADPANINTSASEVISRFPQLNVIVNNAGVQRMHDFGSDKPFDDSGAQQEINTNISGVIRIVAAFLPHLKMQPYATIINITSGLAFLPLARFPIYCATKAFVHSFSMSLRHQLKDSTVSVLELAPPWVQTDLNAGHNDTTSPNSGMSPMPLPEFIEAAMTELASEGNELAVAGAKFLYTAGISERAASAFEQINQ